MVLGFLMFTFIFKTESIPHRNLVDTQISQYSDRHITPNAIAVNPEFKNLTFDPVSTKSSFFSSQIATVIKAVRSLTSLPTKESETKEYGTWIWTPVMEMTPAYMEDVLSQAKNNGVNTIYISIDSYLDIFVMSKGEEREIAKKIFSEKLEDFIVKAHSKNIVVDAEAGWRNWAEEGNIYKAFAIVNYIKNFNAEHENKFRGFQYDVEPYLLKLYKEDPAPVLKNFVTLVDQTQYFIGDSTLRFSVVVPDFYDGKDEFTPKFSYNGKKDYTFKHLLNILDKRANSSIIIMSYRSFATGFDGSIEISNNEMQTAKSGTHRTKIIIAQETGDVPPPYITFHRTSKEYLGRQIESINNTFKPYANFGGIAVHYVNAFLALK